MEAAIIAGLVALMTSLLTALVTVTVAQNRSRVDEKITQLKGEVDKGIAERRMIIDQQLAELKGQFDQQLAAQKARLDNKAQFAAEDVAYEMMAKSEWRLRSLNVIKLHLGGFSEDELRRILVRAGAIRFEAKSGSELWGLLERNGDLLGVTKVPWDPQNQQPLPVWAS